MTRTRLHIGIDPGLDGAIVLIDPETRQLVWYRLHADIARIEGKYLNPFSYNQLFHEIKAFHTGRQAVADVVFLEAARIASGNQGTTTVGANWGIVFSGVYTAGFIAQIVPPNLWKPRMIPKELRSSEKASERKRSSCIEAARRGYTIPGKSAKSQPHDGIADAVLMAHWGSTNPTVFGN